MVDVALKCDCGRVRGMAKNISPWTGNRAVCYCDDCQAFAEFLGREADVLDEYGGTDVYQMTPAQISITQGTEHLQCMRLTPKGLNRWYASCCNTPIGNTASANLPFVGLVHNFMDDTGVRDRNLGPVRDYVQGKHARGQPPGIKVSPGLPMSSAPRLLTKLLYAKLRGKAQPSPFFDAQGRPVSKPIIKGATQKKASV